MIITISDFRQQVLAGDSSPLIARLQELTGRSTAEEATAWTSSFSELARVLSSPRLDPFHLHLGRRGSLSLEYRLPASSSWCDVVLLGEGESSPSALILELKHWDTRNDGTGPAEGLISHAGKLTLHPSEQVGGYVEYCRRFHSTVAEEKASVDGCVVFTARPLNPVYAQSPNDRLVREFPCFGIPRASDGSAFVDHVLQRIRRPAPEFATAFERGHYRQNRGFISTIGTELREKDHRSLVLLDEQRQGLRLALSQARAAISESSKSASAPKKSVLIIQGPPGSGKSAVAAHLWAELATWDGLPPGDLVFVGTSAAQNEAWSHIFGQGRGCLKKATQFSPTTTQRLGALQRSNPGSFKNIEDWRANLQLLETIDGRPDPDDNAYLISIVDEAHALVNPESKDARGQFGFPLCFGPLGYHIIRASSLSVFLIDEVQSFREREATTVNHLRMWAAELGAEVLQVVNLAGRQFRCGGSSEYLEWAGAVLAGSEASACALLAAKWQAPVKSASESGVISTDQSISKPHPSLGETVGFRFEIVPSVHDLDAALTKRRHEGASVRLVSSYARKWVTEKDEGQPHRRPDHMRDFFLPAAENRPAWSRIWNWKNAPRGYVSWIDPSAGDPMAEDPLCEVGCPYTVRGFDYDYLGLIWLSDVVWRRNSWVVQVNHVHESGLTRHKGRAAAESDTHGPAHRALLEKILQGYRILMTRAIKGLYVWCEDSETRARIQECLGKRTHFPSNPE